MWSRCGASSGALHGETTILHFRHLLERHGLGEALFEEINAHLDALGHRLKTGTIVDASIIAVLSSAKNRNRGGGGQEMRRTKKGSQWCFEMKMHIEVDAEMGLAHRHRLTRRVNPSATTERRRKTPRSVVDHASNRTVFDRKCNAWVSNAPRLLCTSTQQLL